MGKVKIRKFSTQSDPFSTKEPFVFLGKGSKGYAYEIKDKDKRLWESVNGPAWVDYLLGRVIYKEKPEEVSIDGRFFTTRLIAEAERYNLNSTNKPIDTTGLGEGRYSKRTTAPLLIEVKVTDFDYKDGLEEYIEKGRPVLISVNNFSGLFSPCSELEYGEVEFEQTKPVLYENYTWGDY